jgi:hypothetical protein
VKRPLPPDLVALGDQLESAAARRHGNRRAHRQLALNLAASVAIAVPLVASLGADISRRGPVSLAPRPTPTVAPAVSQLNFDVPPRRVRSLVNPSPSPVPDPRGAQR